MTRIIIAALAALALAAPVASADPHAIDAHNRAQQAKKEARAELQARGRDGVQTGSLAGTTDATARALQQERAYSSYGEPTPVAEAPAPKAATADDDAPWALIAIGIAGAALIAAGVVVTARRSRVAT